MKLRIEDINEPKRKIPTMVYDVKLNDNLDKFPALHNSNKFCFNLVLGKPGQGKSSMLYSLFKSGGKNRIFKRVFENVILFMPKNSRDSFADNIFNTLPDENLFDELNEENLLSVQQKCSVDSKDGYKSIIILDDVTSSLKDTSLQKILKEIIYNRRHNKTSILILSQSYIALPKEIRKLLNNIFMYKCSKAENETIFQEQFESKKEYLNEILRVIFDKPHQFMILDTDNQKIFKNMNQEIIMDDEDE